MASSETRNDLITVNITSGEIMKEVPQGIRRTQLIITNNTASTVTIAKGRISAVANTGIPLGQNNTYFEATDGGFTCWQGAVQAIATVASSVSIVEVLEFL